MLGCGDAWNRDPAKGEVEHRSDHDGELEDDVKKNEGDRPELEEPDESEGEQLVEGYPQRGAIACLSAEQKQTRVGVASGVLR